jgi:hypothetical protein
MGVLAMTDLLPCPFCGNSAIMDIHHENDDGTGIIEFAVVRCSYCRTSKERPSPTAAAEVWNTRAQLQRSQEPVAWKYDWRMKMFAYDDEDGWVTTVSFKQPKEDHRNGYRNVTPLCAASDTALTRIRELEGAFAALRDDPSTPAWIQTFATAALSSKDQEKING